MNFPLVMVMIFGLIISNWELIQLPDFLKPYRETASGTLRKHIQQVTGEMSFLLRSLFFLLFGFTISFQHFGEPEVIIAGTVITLILLGIRTLYLALFSEHICFPKFSICQEA